MTLVSRRNSPNIDACEPMRRSIDSVRLMGYDGEDSESVYSVEIVTATLDV